MYMLISKKILILLVILFFTFIIWHLIMQRMKIAAQMKALNAVDGFTGLTIFTTPDTELTQVTKNDAVSIVSMNKAFLSQPLRQFCIMASYNTAVTGSFVNVDMIKYVLQRGCRYLDFEIFMIPNDKGTSIPQVAYSTDPNLQIIDTKNSILLSDAFSKVMSNAFSSTSPNNSDPLFINMRVKSNDTSIYKAIANVVYSILENKLYVGKVTKDTQIGNLMGKIVLIMDRTVSPTYAKYCNCSDGDNSCIDLTNYINIESGTTALYQVKYSEIMNQSSIQINTLLDICSVCTDIRHFRIVLPDSNFYTKQNPIVDDLITNYGAQIVPFRFNSVDNGLAKYETLFNNPKTRTAFLPLANAIKYIKDVNDVTAW
jgi:hypothetical protein